MKHKLRIAQIVLPWIPLPPPAYSGTERVVYNLTEGLHKRGHEVTLVSVGESKTSASLVSVFERALGLQDDVSETLKHSFYPLMHVAEGFRLQDKFDIIHSHAQFLGLPFGGVSKTPSVHTFHRTFTGLHKDEEDLVKQYNYLNFTSISNHQRVPGINYVATVYNGIDTTLFQPATSPKNDYLFWAGRVVQKKGIREAIQIAKSLGYPLKIAGKITDQKYFDTYVKPEIDGKLISFHGEVKQSEMIQFYQHAKVTLIPVTWNEPFGLTTVESMSCATPVVAYAQGGVAETLTDGVGGYLVKEEDGVSALIARTKEILALGSNEYAQMSEQARTHVQKHFSIEKMVDGYESVYYKILGLA